jgi:tRNA threonylcarbamoyladenosine biosynthesis protein TsaB
MKDDAPLGPYLLAIDTATAIGSVAVFSQDRLQGSQQIRRQASHARLLMPMIEALLHQLDLTPGDLAAIGVSRGPGSYTGLRVGVSTAKGLCYALDRPLLSLSSLQSLAHQQRELAQRLEARIMPMIDARRMEVYCAPFDAQGQPLAEIEARIVTEETFATWLDQGRMIFCGDGAAKCRRLLEAHPQSIVLGEALSHASYMGWGLWQCFQAQRFEDLTTFEPFYLKDFRATKPKDPLRRHRDQHNQG